MRTKNSYIKKYGREAGSIIFKLLQKEAAHAQWKHQYRKRVKQFQVVIKRLEKKIRKG